MAMTEPATIYAPATAPGEAAIAVVRVSGPAAGAALRALSGRAPPPPRTATLRQLRHPESGALIDEALVLWFAAPASYSGEDMVEYHIHGGAAVQAALLDALAACAGLAPAPPGGFTRQAVRNGRMDLLRAEAIADLIAADSPAQHAQALAQKAGGLGALYEGWRLRLTDALAHMEAGLEFADEDLPSTLDECAQRAAQGVADEITTHLADTRGERLRTGLTVALLGAPNVGKSSLLNRLAGREAAIVSARAGTTRDVLEVGLRLEGLPLVLVDTAGLRAARGTIEREGVRRARARARDADMRLFLCAPRQLAVPQMAQLQRRGDILVYNKADLRGRAPPDSLPVSARTGAGLTALLKLLGERLRSRFAPRAAPALTRARHRRALEDAAEALARAKAETAAELVAENLRLAEQALAQLTGHANMERVLDAVFRDFCIGK